MTPKFRALYKPLKLMLDADKIESINFETKTLGVYMPIENKNFHKLRLSDFELMQFTGLKDKNGKEIYEGDEFQAGKSKGFVKYYADSFEIEWYHNPENWNEHLRHHVGHGEVTGGHVHDTHSEVSP